MSDDIVTFEQALQILKMSRSSLYRRISHGDIAPLREKTGLKQPRLKFRREDVEALLQTSEQESAPENKVA